MWELYNIKVFKLFSICIIIYQKIVFKRKKKKEILQFYSQKYIFRKKNFKNYFWVKILSIFVDPLEAEIFFFIWIYFISFPFPTFFPGLDMMVRSWFLGQRGDSSGRLSGGQIGWDTAGLLRKTGTEEKQRRK